MWWILWMRRRVEVVKGSLAVEAFAQSYAS